MIKITARLTDQFVGICTAHSPPKSVSGIIIKGSSTVFVNNLAEARLTDTCLGDCGHTGPIITASGTVFDENLPVARVTDKVGPPFDATIVKGSPNDFTGD